MHIAAAGGHTRCCQLLVSTRNHDLDKSLSVHIRDAEGRTPLMLAAAAGHAGAVEVLVRAGAEMRDALEVSRGATEIDMHPSRPTKAWMHGEGCYCVM